jgi:hypothetical protein
MQKPIPTPPHCNFPDQRDKQLSATIDAMIGIAPKDELERMIAGQLIASHNAAMECYQRALIPFFKYRRDGVAKGATSISGASGGPSARA